MTPRKQDFSANTESTAKPSSGPATLPILSIKPDHTVPSCNSAGTPDASARMKASAKMRTQKR